LVVVVFAFVVILICTVVFCASIVYFIL
jgi:hypothetical protein